MINREVIWDIAHLAHVELLTPKLEESTLFFTDILGMSVSDIKGDSIYLGLMMIMNIIL